MDNATLIAQLDFTRARLLGTLEAIEKSGYDVGKVLAWSPAPGRAHLAWQAMHCAATHDRYVNVRLRDATETDPELVKNFAGGSTPSDDIVPALPVIRAALEKHYTTFKEFVRTASAQEIARSMDFPNNVKRTVGESIILLAWHEAHHQGQMHITWNMYKAQHPMV